MRKRLFKFMMDLAVYSVMGILFLVYFAIAAGII